MMDHGRADDNDSLALDAISSAPSRPRTLQPTSSVPNIRVQRSISPGPVIGLQSSTARSDRRRPTLEDRRQPSIRLRRLGSSSTLDSTHTAAADFAYEQQQQQQQEQQQQQQAGTDTGNRQRSSSEPQRPPWASSNSHLTLPRGTGQHDAGHMPSLQEESGRPSMTLPRDFRPDAHLESGLGPSTPPARPGLFSRASVAALGALRRQQDPNATPRRRPRGVSSATEYESSLVDLLDVVDPEVATLTTLTNMQNSLFIPDLGSFLNRRPTYTLTHDPTYWTERQAQRQSKPPSVVNEAPPQPLNDHSAAPGERPSTLQRNFTISSHLSETEDHYAVLPQGITLDGWSLAEKEELNDHVRHLLHSRRAGFKRTMKGFGQYVRRPLGLFVTVYATLVTLFGLAWVLFLIGWINVGGRQSYLINVIDNVLVALFALVGDTLAPFRAVDTYHMIYIAHYHHLTWNLRKKRNMPKLKNENDLPLQPGIDADGHVEADAASIAHSKPKSIQELEEESVLTPDQQKKLKHHEDKFSKSHTFYKPHETETHHAFPLRLLVAIVVLLDFHSIFQIALGTCTWSISYKVRPFALTTVILCCSITCNIMGGILITVGDKTTRKKDVVERMFRQQLTEQAINKIEKRRQKFEDRNDDLDKAVTPEA